MLGAGARDVQAHREGQRHATPRQAATTAFLRPSPLLRALRPPPRCSAACAPRAELSHAPRSGLRRYHAFLDRVPVLASLGRYEKCRLLDAIRTQARHRHRTLHTARAAGGEEGRGKGRGAGVGAPARG